jgi:hypothetical protein
MNQKAQAKSNSVHAFGLVVFAVFVLVGCSAENSVPDSTVSESNTTIYQVKGPDGQIYEVKGPRGATDEEVILALQRQLYLEAQLLLANSANNRGRGTGSTLGPNGELYLHGPASTLGPNGELYLHGPASTLGPKGELYLHAPGSTLGPKGELYLHAPGSTLGPKGELYLHAPGSTLGPNGELYIHSP